MKEFFDVFSNKFANDIFLQKYSMNGTETWADMTKRVVESVCGNLISAKEKAKIYKFILERKFIPGGRYLYSSGREFHQTNNCVLFRAEDSREGWAELMQKSVASLMTGAGIGVDYSLLRGKGMPIKRTGGYSTGPIALMEMINESGRHIMQGGSRRSAIWAGLNWKHPDILSFMQLKNWPQKLKDLKEKDLEFRMPMELTNISVIYDTNFFVAIESEEHPDHKLAKEVWTNNCIQAFKTAEPGMSFNFRKDNESLRNACQPGFATLNTINGIKTFDEVNVGDFIEFKDKKWTTIKNKWSTGIKDVYCYTTNHGNIFVGTNNHKILTENNKKIEVETCFISEIPIQSIFRNDERFIAKHYLGKHKVYEITVEDDAHVYNTGGIIVSNCTEVVSEDDSDKCNLGTIWVNRCSDKKEFAEVVKYSTLFLLCGGIYSDVPTEKIKQVGLANNRIGLGLGGIHEWLMLKGYEYQCVPELHQWLSIYEEESDGMAYVGARQLRVSVPQGVRAIAPTGTIGIIAESTTGIEPLFCKAYKRRYLKENTWVYQYVVDGTVKRLLDAGIAMDKVKDSFDLTFRQRVKFQADVQKYVDMSISSTCNMPYWGSDQNNENNVENKANTLLKYAKRLRGFTVYPDGARTGQPLTRVSLEEAIQNEGVIFEETENSCINGVCGL